MDSSELDDLAKEFAAIGADLHGGSENGTALHRMMQLAVKHIPGCSWASITLIAGRGGRTVASSDPVARAADQLQYELDEGPCLQAAEEGHSYLLFDVEHEPRWPRYVRALREQTPVRSVLSYTLAAEDRAALNLFGASAGCYDDEAVQFGAIFAAHASSAVALYDAEERAHNLQIALASNRQIGMAIGILMAHHRVTQEDAFALLRIASQHLHIKLRDLAQEVVETGVLPICRTR
jgi:ANTAR domain-containing protein/GAF domain-containing protein